MYGCGKPWFVEHDVLRVQLTGVAQQAGLAAARLDERDECSTCVSEKSDFIGGISEQRVHVARVVEVRALPVVGMPARLLREVGAGALGAEQVRRLVAAVEVARLRDLG